MIDRTHRLSVTRQARRLQLSHASVYYVPRPVPAPDLMLMHRIDAWHLELPFAGSRMLRDILNTEHVVIGRTHVRTLMRRTGIAAISRRPRTSQRHRAHLVIPYLLRTLTVERPHQVWTTDITYIPMARGFGFLVAIMDWDTRKVLTWRVSPTQACSRFEMVPIVEALQLLHRRLQQRAAGASPHRAPDA